MEGGNSQAASLGGHWVESQSAEYDLVRYQLTAALANLGTVEKLSVWKIENMELNYKYERRSNGMLRLTGWQNAESLSGENSLEQICARGFHFDPALAKGLTLATGIIEPLAEYALSMEQCFMFYEMAVGKSFVYDGDLSQAEIPQGYDSLYIPPKPLDRNRDGKFSLQEYQSAATFDQRTSKEYNHRYFIADINQVSPKYIVRFRVQKLKDNVRASDYLHLIHSGGVNDVQFIDPITLQPGNPNGGGLAGSAYSVASGGFYHDGPTTPGRSSMNALDKKFLPVEKVYTQAVEEVTYFDNDAAMISKNQWVNRQLSSIEDKVREISLNYAEMVEVIEEAAKQAKERLQLAVRQKLELCLSLEIELRRETEQMNWLQDTMTSELKKYQQAIVESNSNDSTRRKLMLQFLKLWKQHSLMRNNLCRSKPNELQALATVHGDIRIQPDIKLYTDPFHANHGNKKDSTDTKAASDHHQVNRFLHDFSERAKTLEMFTPATVTGQNSLIPSAVQSVIDQEMEAIQRIVVEDSNDQALRLPNSIIRPLLGGNHTTLPLHAALDWLKKEFPQDVNNLSDVMESASNVGDGEEMKEVLKDSFANALPAALGYNPDHANTQGDGNQAETLPSPPPFAQSSSMPPAPTSPKSNHQKLDLQQLSLTPREGAHDPISPISSVSKFGGSTAGMKKADPPVDQQAHGGMSQTGLFANGDTDLEVKMSLPQLKSLSHTYKHNSISELGAKKHKQLQVRLAAGIDQLGYNPLKSSRIVLPEEVENLYYCLPFFSKPPMLRALYSTYTHRRSLEELFSKTIKNRNPTLMLIRSGDYRFGAYLSHAPVPTSSWMGSPSCFIFSLSLNVKVPFHGRQVLGETNLQEPMALFCHGDRIFIGNGDLSIDDKLMSGSSELENSYGLGMEQHSTEAMCLLAGSPVFPISDLELWTIIV